ncbi:hypothetical protein [Rubritalea sp.]|uniref:hypothetical protein n=1 Tax=Rubritalea sp. TaxID=2109375 RepID=UPI003EF5CB0D
MNTTIHVSWDGPYTLDQIHKLQSNCDYGIYQIYGPSPTYGKVELLYIGQSNKQTFGIRIPAHSGWISGTRDMSQIQIYIGRLAGNTPDTLTWESHIDAAERLLIYAHFPPYNTQKWTRGDVSNYHVLNWGRYRDLFPEVSGQRWTETNEPAELYGDTKIAFV